jgi:RNA polymerase sigma-70 factor, ECF subfamily
MENTIQQAEFSALAAYLPAGAIGATIDNYQRVFDQNRQRIYALSFWMTDNELVAEEMLASTFCRAFAKSDSPTAVEIDQAFISEARELCPIGLLTLECETATEIMNVRSNIKRVHLERAVVQLPATERLIYLLHDGEGYNHARISSMLGLTVDESCVGLHQARLRIRELVASMN